MPDFTFSHVPGMKDAAAVPTLSAETLGESMFVGEYVAKSRPCVIKGGVRHWAAIEKWRDKDYLKKRAGHHQVYLYPNEYHTTPKRMEAAGRRQLTLAEAIDHLDAQDTRIGIVVTGHPTELQADLGGIGFLKSAETAFVCPPARYFFFRNAGTTWHYHPFDETLMCQIVGSKKIGLLDVNNAARETIRDIFFHEDYYDDPSVFDGLDTAGLSWLEATLDPGDALYIPPLWWHGVVPTTRYFGSTAAVTWRSPPHVIADTLRRMASGQADMIGKGSVPNFDALLKVARKMGMEKELAIAWQRGL
jgi:hypothetical protein